MIFSIASGNKWIAGIIALKGDFVGDIVHLSEVVLSHNIDKDRILLGERYLIFLYKNLLNEYEN